MSLSITCGQLNELKTNNVVRVSQCSCVGHNMTNASGRKCTIVSHQFRSKGFLGNLGQVYGQLKLGSFGHIKPATIEKFQSLQVWQPKKICCQVCGNQFFIIIMHLILVINLVTKKIWLLSLW
jgi:hypothetical protein